MLTTWARPPVALLLSAHPQLWENSAKARTCPSQESIGQHFHGSRDSPRGITVTDHDSPNSGIKKPLKVEAVGPRGIQHPTPLTSALPGSQDNIRPPQMAPGDASTDISSLGCTPEPKHGGLACSPSPGLAETKLSGPRAGSLCAAFTVGRIVGARRG